MRTIVAPTAIVANLWAYNFLDVLVIVMGTCLTLIAVMHLKSFQFYFSDCIMFYPSGISNNRVLQLLSYFGEPL